MNPISTTFKNLNTAKPGLLQSSFNTVGSWAGRGINMIRLIPQQVQSNTFKALGVVVGINALFVLGMHFFVNHLDHRLENQKEGLDSDQRIFKVLLLNIVVLGGSSLVFNSLLSKYTKFPLKGSHLVCIATINVAARVLVNRFVTQLISKKKVVEEDKSQDKGPKEEGKGTEKSSPKPLTPVTPPLKEETLKNPETAQNGNPSNVKVQDVEPKKEENPVQTTNTAADSLVASEASAESNDVASQGIQGENKLEVKPEEQPAVVVTEEPEEKPAEEAQTGTPPSTDSESQPQTTEVHLNDQPSQQTAATVHTASNEAQNPSQVMIYDSIPVVEDVDNDTTSMELPLGKSQATSQKAANSTHTASKGSLTLTSAITPMGIGQMALSMKFKSKLSQSTKASTAPVKSANHTDDFMKLLMMSGI